MEEIFERNSLEHLNHLKKLLDDAKHEAVEEINVQLGKLREVKQLGKF